MDASDTNRVWLSKLLEMTCKHMFCRGSDWGISIGATFGMSYNALVALTIFSMLV